MNLGRSCGQQTQTEHSSKGLRQLTRAGRTSLALRRSPARDSVRTFVDRLASNTDPRCVRPCTLQNGCVGYPWVEKRTNPSASGVCAWRRAAPRPVPFRTVPKGSRCARQVRVTGRLSARLEHPSTQRYQVRLPPRWEEGQPPPGNRLPPCLCSSRPFPSG